MGAYIIIIMKESRCHFPTFLKMSF